MTCGTTGKRCFWTKREAKRVARLVRRKADRMSAYQCGDHWHIGHLAPDVLAGEVDRRELRK